MLNFRNCLCFLVLSIILVPSVWAYVPEPQSMGKYTYGKGTKASEEYENRAGGPVYEFGKGLQLGPVHVKPNFDYNVRYDNNVFYEENGRKSDTIQVFNTDTKAEVPFNGGQHLGHGSFATHSEWFGRFDTQDHTDYTTKVGLDLNFVPFTLNLENGYDQTFSRANTEFTDRIERGENSFHSLLEVPFSMIFFENEITNFTENYSRAQDSTFDHNEFTVFQRVGYELSPVTQVLAEYAYEDIHYFKVRDREGSAHQVMGGLRGNLTELIAYQLWLGAQYRKYDESSRPDFNGFVMRSTITFEPSATDVITLRGERQPQESTFDNQSFYTRNRAELYWQKQIMERVYFNTRESLDYNEYSRITVLNNTERTRRDYVWQTSVGLEYRMPNDIFSFRADYRIAGRETNIAGLPYDDQTFSLGAHASF